MRPVPELIVELQRRAAESYRWRVEGQIVDPEHAGGRWGPDPAIVDELVAAEVAWTGELYRLRREAGEVS